LAAAEREAVMRLDLDPLVEAVRQLLRFERDERRDFVPDHLLHAMHAQLIAGTERPALRSLPRVPRVLARPREALLILGADLDRAGPLSGLRVVVRDGHSRARIKGERELEPPGEYVNDR